jgi:hypothetical protein
MASCNNKNKNTDFCPCTYPSCSRKGICCECIRYHLSNDELPACFFPVEAEKTYDRSKKYYLSLSSK